MATGTAAPVLSRDHDGVVIVDGERLDYGQIIKPIVQYELYNPADEPIEFMYGGEIYQIPAADVRWKGRHPQTGELTTWPLPGILPLWGRPSAGISALDILKHGVGDDGATGAVGGRGIRPLFGDDKKDPAVMREARAAWVEAEVTKHTAATRAHETAVRLAGENQMERPIPSRRVQKAYQFLSINAQSLARAFSCAVCNWGFPTDPELQIHYHTIHPNTEHAATAREKLGLTGQHQNSGAPDTVRKGGGKTVPAGDLDLRPTGTAAVVIKSDGSGPHKDTDLNP